MTVKNLSRVRGEPAAAGLPGRRKWLESEIRSYREMLEETQQIAQIGSWRFDRVRGKTYWSREAARIFEIDRRAATSPDVFLALIHPDDREAVDAAYRAAEEQGETQVIDYRLQFRNGRIKDVRERRTVERDGNGNLLRLRGTIQDVTEVRLAEALLELVITTSTNDHSAEVEGIANEIMQRKCIAERLRLGEQDFRVIAENAADRIARYDTDCRCIYMNQALRQLFGRPDPGLLGTRPTEAGGDALLPYEEKIREVLQTGKESEMELFSPHLSCAVEPVYDHIRFTPECGFDGKVTGVLVIGRDVRSFKKVQHELSLSGAMLRALVARQEREREGERKRVAWEIHEEIGQLLATLRFELHQPSRGEPTAPQPLRAQQSPAIRLLDRAIGTVRKLTASLHPQVLDLGVEVAMEWLAEGFTRQNAVPCYVNCEETMPLNEEQMTVLFRVVQEALDNVARHADASSVNIVTACRGPDYVLTIRDDGKGFDPERTREPSTGLLLIRERIRSVNGKVSIHSAPGQGTSIEVRLAAALSTSTDIP